MIETASDRFVWVAKGIVLLANIGASMFEHQT